jgi:hypothetical protein
MLHTAVCSCAYQTFTELYIAEQGCPEKAPGSAQLLHVDSVVLLLTLQVFGPGHSSSAQAQQCIRTAAQAHMCGNRSS